MKWKGKMKASEEDEILAISLLHEQDIDICAFTGLEFFPTFS